LRRIARTAISIAGLLWFGGSAALAGQAAPLDALLWVLANTDQPDLGAYERKVEGIRRGLAALDRIEGSYAAGDNSVAYVALVDVTFQSS
jgi:hypothetical protein